MERPQGKDWDPACPKCQEDLQRHIDLSEALHDEVDHGVGKGAPWEGHSCNHERKRAADAPR